MVLRHDQTAVAMTLCWKVHQTFLKKRNTCPGHWRQYSADNHLEAVAQNQSHLFLRTGTTEAQFFFYFMIQNTWSSSVIYAILTLY